MLARQGVNVPYSSLHRFPVHHCGFADRRRLTVHRAETAPGELVEVAGQRTHETTRRRPLVVFETEEKATLRPLVAGRFEL